MALADYLHRDAVAISQILQGFETDAFVERLEDVRVTIAFGEQAVASGDGRDLLDLTIRLAARLYPSLSVATTAGGEQAAAELTRLARDINPKIEVSEVSSPNIALSIGTDAPAIDAPTIYAGCCGWVGQVGTRHPYETNDVGNPFGAGFAACLAAANLFRCLFLPEGIAVADEDTSFPADGDSLPRLTAEPLTDSLVLVGAGAIGNSAAWALARTPLIGKVYLVDPEAVELSNLQRYALCTRCDEGGTKVDIAARAFRNGLQPVTYRGTWASFLEAYGYRWERVMVAVDSARDRRAVQASLPRWIANAWTQIGDLGASTHTFLGPGACLSCLYLPAQESKSDDQIIAEGLKIPELQDQVRVLLGSGRGADEAICVAIADAWQVPISKLGQYVGKPIRELWAEGVCGGGIIPLGGAGPTPRDLQVPLAFQSALAGVLLAAETARDILTAGAQRETQVRRMDLLRPVGESHPQKALKSGTGRCICEDQDFVSAYQAKYELR